jgi:hypothetical protein
VAQEKELAVELAQQEQDRRHQELIRLVKDQEDRIREEGERDIRIQEQTTRIKTLQAGVLQSLSQLQELWDSQPEKGEFSGESRQALEVKSQVLQAVNEVSALASRGAATLSDWDR